MTKRLAGKAAPTDGRPSLELVMDQDGNLNAPALNSAQVYQYIQYYHRNLHELHIVVWFCRQHDNWKQIGKYETWEDFCRGEFSLSRRHANRIVTGYQITIDVGSTLPEGQARELIHVPQDQRADVLKIARETAPLNPKTQRPQLSAAHLRQTAAPFIEAAGLAPSEEPLTPESKPTPLRDKRDHEPTYSKPVSGGLAMSGPTERVPSLAQRANDTGLACFTEQHFTIVADPKQDHIYLEYRDGETVARITLPASLVIRTLGFGMWPQGVA